MSKLKQFATSLCLVGIILLLSSQPILATAYPLLVSSIDIPVPGEPWRLATTLDTKIVGRFAFILLGLSTASAQTPSEANYIQYTRRALAIVDITNPQHPTIIGYSPPDLQNSVTFSSFNITKGYAYISGYSNNPLMVYDVRNPRQIPPLVYGSSNADIVVNSLSIATDGNYLYLHKDGASITAYIISISDPKKPTITGSLVNDDIRQNFAVSGNYLYVKHINTSTIYVLDVSTPSSPQVVSSIFTDTNTAPGDVGRRPHTIVVSEPYLYSSNNLKRSLQVIDIHNPEAPKIINSLPLEDHPGNLFITGKYLYMVTDPFTGFTTSIGSFGYSNYRLYIIDVSDSNKPRVVTTVPIAKDGQITQSVGQTGSVGTIHPLPDGLYINGRYAYVTNRAGFMEIFYLGPYADYTNSLTIDIPTKTANNSNYQTLSFTAKVSLPQKELGMETENQVQVKLSSGQTVPLKFDHAEGKDTVWTGTLKQAKNNTSSKTSVQLTGALEQVAANTIGPDKTHFTSLPTDFSNEGISLDFDIKNATPGSYTIKSVPGDKADKILTEYSSPSSNNPPSPAPLLKQTLSLVENLPTELIQLLLAGLSLIKVQTLDRLPFLH